MMRRFTLTLLAATAIGMVASQGALAADLRPALKAPPPLPPPVQDWSGIYVGVEGGGGWGHAQGLTAPFTQDPSIGQFLTTGSGTFDDFFDFHEDLRDIRGAAAASLGGVDTSGWLFGAFFGAQKQWGNWVLGIEGDVDGADIKGSVNGFSSAQIIENEAIIGTDNEITRAIHAISLENKIDELASIRGKIGWAWSPNWMIYATGGAAFAHVKNSLSETQSTDFGVFCGSNTVPSFDNCDRFFHAAEAFTASSDQSMLGWTIGAGIDYKWQLDPGSALVFGVEYQYFNFPSQTFTFSGPSGASLAFNTSETINVVKGKISYLFSIH